MVEVEKAVTQTGRDGSRRRVEAGDDADTPADGARVVFRHTYKIASTVWRCLLGLALLYLRKLCCPLHSAMSSRSLRSSKQGLLPVPFARTSAKQSRAFSVVGPSIWNGLPSQLRTLPRALSP